MVDNAPEVLFFRGIVANRFQRPTESITQFDNYLALAGTADRPRLAKAHETLADNYLKTFQYGRAADEYATILDTLR